MNRTPPDSPSRTRLVCPTCHERMDAPLRGEAYVVTCTYCQAPVSVPSLSQAQRAQQARQPLPAPTVEEYRVAPPEAGPGAQTETATAGGERPLQTAARGGSADAVVVACPSCHERLQATAAAREGQVECTFCGTRFPVPARDAIPHRRKQQVAPQRPEQLGEYGVTAPPERPPLRTNLFERMAEIRSEPPVRPPEWTFFTGVFTFPWRKPVVIRWGGIAAGLTFVVLLAGFLLGGGAGGGPAGLGVVAMGFFVLPLFWVFLLTASFAADAFLRILESTAAGMDDVEAWSEGGWKEWMPSLLYLLWIASIPAAVSFGVARLAELGGAGFWPALLVMIGTLFPVVLLSALEANSVWIPITWPILRSLFHVWWGWLLFYGLSGLMAAGLWAHVHYAQADYEWLMLVSLGPLLAAAVLIEARLLGRLAWKIGQSLPD